MDFTQDTFIRAFHRLHEFRDDAAFSTWLPIEGDEVSDEKANAVFVMSQPGRRAAIEPLIQVARTNRDPRVRSKAMVWLGEAGDARAIALSRKCCRDGSDVRR